MRRHPGQRGVRAQRPLCAPGRGQGLCDRLPAGDCQVFPHPGPGRQPYPGHHGPGRQQDRHLPHLGGGEGGHEGAHCGAGSGQVPFSVGEAAGLHDPPGGRHGQRGH